MKSFSVSSEKLQNFNCFTWISTDTAVAASLSDRCLYEIILSPSLQGVRASKISQPFPASILCIQALIPGCGAAPSAASNAPTSQANQKSPFQLARASGQSSDFGQTIISVGCSDGTISFLYADVVQLGGQGQRVNIRRQKTHNLKEFIQSPDDVMPVTCMCLMQPRGSNLIVGTETGYLCMFSLTSGAFQFKQLLRNDLQSPIHCLCSISKNLVAFTFKNQLQIISLNRPSSPEVVYKTPENTAITTLACSSQILAIGAEHGGVVFYDLLQNLEVSTCPAPPGDAISSLSCSITSEDFVAGTRRGAILVYSKNGVLREASSTFESISETTTPGGITTLAYAPYGGVYFALCHSGFCYGVIYPRRISSGSIVFEPIDELKLRIIDNNLQINDIYTSPEPLTGLFMSNYSSSAVFIATTMTSVMVWVPPSTAQAAQMKNVSVTLKNQWIQEPLRTQSFSESLQMNRGATQQSEQTSAIQAQTVGGVQFGVFNFEKTEEQAAKAAISQSEYSPICKTALYLRHSVCYATASDKYLVLQDISGECHVCLLQNLGLVHSIYNGICYGDQISVSDEILVYTEGPIIRITEMASGNYIAKQIVHQRRILQTAISFIGQVASSQVQKQGEAKVDIQLGNIFGGIVGATNQPTSQMTQAATQARSQQQTIIALLDASSAVFVHQLVNNAAYYQKISQTQQAFNQLNIQTKVLSIQFPPRSQILTCLAQDSPNLQAPTTFLGTPDNPDYSTRLRCILFAQPTTYDLSLPLPIFVAPVAISLTQILRQAAGIGFEEVVDNSSRQIQQYKLLIRQRCYTIRRVNQTVRLQQTVSAGLNVTNCIIELLSGSCFVNIPLPEFPFLIEQFQKDNQVTQRLCRYVQQPALWSFLCGYARQQQDVNTLRLALAAVGQVPKAIHEAEILDVDYLCEQGKIGKAVQVCCDLWDFERGRQIVSRDRRFGPLLVYLRRQLYMELGSIADEKSEPWLGLAREFGDKATEQVMSMIEK
ncbi:Intraflagellar_transport protein IFT80 [Hexamita inflata]|uniref:Intraflagellar transport protein IFT80 n=1 Tax=Hexamita inflata TaxID=28002 RepID=A0AA86PQE9_9EUKA|nr:Intraflagellar transport protein IFT80 [Hexamita inflata]